MGEILEIDTTGWTDISCDKCGNTMSFSPSHPEEFRRCYNCNPPSGDPAPPTEDGK